jgi:F0F1-type ATP synthase membrane subunit b/b'
MEWNLSPSLMFSFFLNHEEAFIEFNPNILETNVINILLLIGLLVYVNQTSFSKNLENRQIAIIQSIENVQQDLVKASNYYNLAEKGFSQTVFWLQTWKNIYQKEKLEIVTLKYNTVKKSLSETFFAIESLIKNFEKKAFLSLQRYILLITASKILRKFLFLSEKEQSKLIELIISNLGGK